VIELAKPAQPLAGPLRFIRYGFMPNHLRYCGGDDNRTIFEYGLENTIDPGLFPLLRKFIGALPYLKLIARENGLTDPFDDRVVEAYWIGNELLERVEARQLYDTVLTRVSRELSGRTRDWVLSKAPAGARPHHNFHVFDVYSRVNQIGETLITMDQCRVSWGKVIAVAGPELIVERQPLRLVDGKLALGPSQTIHSLLQIDGRGLVHTVAPGDWVSLHWNWVCETLSPTQQAALARYTAYHLKIANQTL